MLQARTIIAAAAASLILTGSPFRKAHAIVPPSTSLEDDNPSFQGIDPFVETLRQDMRTMEIYLLELKVCEQITMHKTQKEISHDPVRPFAGKDRRRSTRDPAADHRAKNPANL